MKIAVCVNGFPRISEKFILYQIKDLLEMDHDVHIYAFIRSRYSKVHPEVAEYDLLSKTTYLDEKLPSRRHQRIFKALGVIGRFIFTHPREIFRCLSDKDAPAFIDKIKNLCVLAKFLEKNIEVVHCHFGTVANQLIFLKKIIPSIRFVTTFHLYDLRIGLEDGGQIYRELFQKADTIISICSYNREHLKNFGCPQEKLVDHHNGIDTKIFRPGPSRNHPGHYVITTVARLVEQKNIFFALDVMKALKEQTKHRLKYHLIGDGDLKNEIAKRIKELDIDDIVVMFGDLSSDEVIQQLQESDIFFLPSQHEAFPTVVLEAQAVGIPVVATDTGGTRETFLEGKTGYLISQNDVPKAVSRINYLLENDIIREQFGKMGRSFAEENFDISKLNRKLEQLYQIPLKTVVSHNRKAKK